MPLIDVIFLLLTFFIFAMVLMVRAELLPFELQTFITGEPATPAPAITISIDLDGAIFVDREPVTLDTVREVVTTRAAELPDARLYLALADGNGTTDRGPVLTALWDALKDAGLGISFVGKPSDPAAAGLAP
ncbi:MAG: biopolymer transporter ExbD [Phycisphaerales bacterium]|nr:biopolymer transporter ExbD [Phycisphaerales bacterium]